MDDKDWIAGAAKALAIIEAFDEEHARMTPTAVAGRAGLSRTAARRYLLTLRELWLRRHRWQALLARATRVAARAVLSRLRALAAHGAAVPSTDYGDAPGNRARRDSRRTRRRLRRP